MKGEVAQAVREPQKSETIEICASHLTARPPNSAKGAQSCPTTTQAT